MNQKKNFKKILEDNKKLVLFLMLGILLLGIVKIFYQREQNKGVKTEELKESSFVKDKVPINNPLSNVGVMETIDLYNEMKKISPNDTVKVKEINKKLNKIIENEN